MPDHRSYCRICAAACGIVVTVHGDRVQRVRGDEHHPVSRGYVCGKGRGLPDWHHGPNRLDHPRLDGRVVGWPELLDDLAGQLGPILADDPDAIALYLATGLAYDSTGQVAAAQWLPSIGSSSFVTAVTVDNAPVLVAAELVTGEPMCNPVWDPHRPGLALLVGTNPVVSHGYGTALPDPIGHLRDFRGAGGRVWVLDPRASETAHHADVHLAVRPGSDVTVLAALVRALLEDGADERELADHCRPEEVAALRAAVAPFTVDRAAAAAGVEPTLVDALIAEVRAHRGRLVVHCGTGVTMSRDGVVAEWLRWVLLIASGSLDNATGMYFHRGAIHQLRRRPPPDGADGPPAPSPATASSGTGRRPELPRVLGQLACAALVDEIEAGNIRALLVTGGNPLTAFPQPDRLRAALGRLDVLAVVDVAESELTGLATHVLPATGQLERADVTLAELTAVRAGLQATAAVVAPVADRRPVWWMFAALDRALGRPTPGGVDPDLLTDELYLHGILGHSTLDAAEVLAAGPHGVTTEVEHGWVHADLLPDGCWTIAPVALLERLAAHVGPGPGEGLVLAPRREPAWSNSVRFAAAGDERPVVRLHPDDLPEGATSVVLRSRHGTVTASAVGDPAVRRGVASVTHGRTPEGSGRLTSGDEGVDPLTAMPWASGVPVQVEAAGAESAPDPMG